METLSNYIITTLKEAWVNAVLQQDYLAKIWSWLIKYLLYTNIIGLWAWIILLVIAILLSIKAYKIHEDDDYDYDVGKIMFCILVAIVMFIIGISSVWYSWQIILQTIYVPEIAIINYLK